jgi:hypothetical protein
MPAAPSAPAAPPTAAPAPTAKAAPSPAPAKTSATPTPKIEAPKESNDPFNDAFAELDTMETGKKPEPKKAPEKPKAEVEAPDDEQHTATNGDKKPDVKPDEADPKPVKAAELRNAYEGLKKKVKEEYEPQLKELPTLRAKLKEIEARGDDKAAQERIAAIEKRNAELENHIRFVDYEKSKEYQEQFQKPYEEAWSNALRELKGLTMTVEDPNGGEPTTREVTQADIAYLANLDPAARRKEINRLFPEDKEEVKRHINQISTLADKSNAAKEKAKQDADAHAKADAEQRQQSQVTRAKLWRETNESLATKYPKWFSKSEDDQEGNTLFDRGTALADLAFNPSDLTPERIALLPKAFREQIELRKPFTPEQLTQLHAIVRNKASNHDRLASQNKALSARVAELEKTLEDYEKSSPDRISAGGDRVGLANGEVDFGAELDALARKHA